MYGGRYLVEKLDMIVPDLIFKLFVDDDRCFQLVPNSTFHQYNGLYCTLLNDYEILCFTNKSSSSSFKMIKFDIDYQEFRFLETAAIDATC